MRTLSMRNGREPAPALEWRDTADIVIIPLDAFGAECVSQARYLDAALWREETRLRVVTPGEVAASRTDPELPGLDGAPETVRTTLRR